MREALLFLHVLSAATWIGGGFFAVFAYGRLAGSGLDSAGRALRRLSEGGSRYFGPAAGLTLLTGIMLVLTSDPYGWGDAFVIVGLSAFVFSAAFQPLVSGKAEERLLAAVDEGSASVRSELGIFYRNSAIELGVLVFALWAMVAKL